MGGWWGEYSFRCQPIDHSSSPTATRVSCRLRNDENHQQNIENQPKTKSDVWRVNIGNLNKNDHIFLHKSYKTYDETKQRENQTHTHISKYNGLS